MSLSCFQIRALLVVSGQGPRPRNSNRIAHCPLAHLYRGEIYRSKIWRTQLDATHNSAV